MRIDSDFLEKGLQQRLGLDPSQQWTSAAWLCEGICQGDASSLLGYPTFTGET